MFVKKISDNHENKDMFMFVKKINDNHENKNKTCPCLSRNLVIIIKVRTRHVHVCEENVRGREGSDIS